VSVWTPDNVVTPGAGVVRAEFTKAFGITPEAMTAAIPLAPNGVPQDLVEIVGFLISDRAAWIRGSNFIVDGGQIQPCKQYCDVNTDQHLQPGLHNQ
jgi:NAD(P)-dependent dehydrogenase (short-subunit alcohol dehydrogenase family)